VGLAALVRSLASQTCPPHQIIVSVDGDQRPLDADALFPALVIRGRKVGPGGTRNRAIAAATGDLLLFLNDDVVPEPDLIERHIVAAREARDRPAMVLGLARWAVRQPDLLIDRVLRESSLVFFYDRMSNAPRDHDWGPRHAWTLNLSLPRSICEPFSERLAYPMFDDIEWATRVTGRYGAPVLYRPEAVVTHHHWYRPIELARREVMLGHQAWRLADINHALAASMFGGRFVPDLLADRCAELGADLSPAIEAFRVFCETASKPAQRFTPDQVGSIVASIESWRTTARTWGFVRAAKGSLCEEAMDGFCDRFRLRTETAA